MRILDLYCAGGGAAMGYARAGFIPVGVDINRQPNYPFPFIQGDAIRVLSELLYDEIGVEVDGQMLTIRDFDAIHASPPCQRYTRKSANWGRARTSVIEHPDLLAPTRAALMQAEMPWVIENVPGAPIDAHLMLCGSMFGLKIQKHRLFESNVPLVLAPASCKHVGLYNPWQGPGRSAAKHREAQDTPWLPQSGGASRAAGYTGDVNNAIPPAYTEFIGKQLMKAING